MPTAQQQAWLSRVLGTTNSAPGGRGGGKSSSVFDSFKKKFKPVKEAAEEIKELYDEFKEIKEKIDKVEKAYEVFSELYEQAREAKELCDKGDPDGILKARDFLANALDKASEKAKDLKLPPGAKELLQVYAGAIRSTQVVERKNYKAQSFDQAMENVESSGDPEGALAYVRDMLCNGDGVRLSKGEFDKELAAYVKKHPDSKVAAVAGRGSPKECGKAPPAQPSRRTDEQVNVEIIENKVEPLRQKWKEALHDAELAQRLPDYTNRNVETAQQRLAEAKEKEKQATSDIKSAEQSIKFAKANAAPKPKDEIVIGDPVAAAQKKLEKAKAALEKAQQETKAAAAALDTAKGKTAGAKSAIPKAQETARAAEDAYQSARLNWYRQAQHNKKMDLPDDLKEWMSRSGKR